MKQILGIDIDGVIGNSDVMFREYMSKYFNREFKRESVHSFSYEKAFDLTREEMLGFWDYFYKNEGWLKIRPVKGSLKAIERLRDFYKIIIVTGRPSILEEVTFNWLEAHKVFYDKLFLTDFKDKYNYLLNNGHSPRYFIEDHIEFARGLADNGVEVFLLDYPWNRSLKDKEQDNIRRVNNWEEVLDILTKQRAGYEN